MHPVTARRLARRGQVQSEATENDDGSDLYDENEMRARVQELAAGLAGSFSFGVDDTDNKTFKFGRLDNIQKLARDAEAAEAKTPKAKSKSGRK